MGFLKNKENIWKSTNLWKIVPKKWNGMDLVRIEKIEKDETRQRENSKITGFHAYPRKGTTTFFDKGMSF